jgi:hypothetical protein
LEHLEHHSGVLKRHCQVVVAGFEVGESGTPHVQGYLETKGRIRPTEKLRELTGIHWGDDKGKPCRGSRADNVEYCLKDANPWIIHGVRPPPAKMALGELARWDGEGDHPHFTKMTEIIKIVELPENPLRCRKIHWFWEPHGSWGKSMLIRHLIDFHGAIEFGGKGADMRCGMAKYVETNGNGPPVVLINFPRATDSKFVSWTGVEQLKDGCFFSGKYESGMAKYDRPHILCFGNFEPDTDMMSKDRCGGGSPRSLNRSLWRPTPFRLKTSLPGEPAYA